ncbi:N-(2-amino-2-carboxyethyl)-L-glutamate synthase [Demequina sediminis]|uniref:N-(2-amino-2-carboxyethyl)-L-glutamate synthase n=1 Tax=Demequina sediminis TaxID=1930058 RepID=A0ABP9WKW7_9MICO|nr:pyridoxal-phosphate dependent enzyme [Demequina sediminis]BDZ61589.1 2,3-diaminopropionate biosynthesis protein SbnA [Demequina sediminis]
MTHHHNAPVLTSPAGTVHGGYLPTPVTRLDKLFPGSGVPVFAKLDQLQLSGSTKERTARSLLDGLIRDGRLVPGGTVVESTSGNLGMALARQCAQRGYGFIAVVDARANAAACQTMQAYGARVERVETPQDGNRLRARVERVADLLAEDPTAVTTQQYGNPDNPAAHATSTMPELVASLGAPPSRLYVAMSTTGTLLGCQQAIEREGWATELVGVDAEGSALFGGVIAERKLPGLGAGFETELSRHARPDHVRRVSEAAMVRGCRLLARREGLLAGASSGAIVAAIGRDLPELSLCDTVAMLIHDSGSAYLPTVYNEAWVRAEIADADEALGPLDAANPFVAGDARRRG